MPSPERSMDGLHPEGCLGMWREGSQPMGDSSKERLPSDRPDSESARLQ